MTDYVVYSIYQIVIDKENVSVLFIMNSPSH